MDSFAYQARIEALRATKQAQTREKQQLIGSMDHDDWALVLPPPDRREVVQTMSGSGMPITDVRLKGFEPRPNHPSGGFFGPRAVGESFRALMDAHPPYVDPNSSLAGAYMANFMSTASRTGTPTSPSRSTCGMRKPSTSSAQASEPCSTSARTSRSASSSAGAASSARFTITAR